MYIKPIGFIVRRLRSILTVPTVWDQTRIYFDLCVTPVYQMTLCHILTWWNVGYFKYFITII